MGPLDRDFDDVRRFGDVARLAVQKAASAGAVRPALLLVEPPLSADGSGSADGSAYQRPMEVALLGALQEMYVPLEAREWRTYRPGAKGTHLGVGAVVGGQGAAGKVVVAAAPHSLSESTLKAIHAVEQGRLIARGGCGRASLHRVIISGVDFDPSLTSRCSPIFLPLLFPSLQLLHHCLLPSHYSPYTLKTSREATQNVCRRYARLSTWNRASRVYPTSSSPYFVTRKS